MTRRDRESRLKLAREIAALGPKRLEGLRDEEAWLYGDKVWTFSRKERDAWKTFEELVGPYLTAPEPKRPLCLAVFGPPGCGKSFGVKALREELVKKSEVKLPLFEFNLSQLDSTRDLARRLAGAARVRSNLCPFVFFDEFDAPLAGTPLGWLPWLLAPMQDGEFQHDGATVELKRAVYVFAGGTATRLDDFGARDPDGFRAAKGPDFVSRLRAYLDVRGPNDRERRSLRRAFGCWLALGASAKTRGREFELSDDLLGRMLDVGRYRFGQRSLEAVVEMTAANAENARLKAKHLPKDRLLELHTDRGPLAQEAVGGLIGLSGGGGLPATGNKLAQARDSMWMALAESMWKLGATLAYGGNWDPAGLTWTLLNQLDDLPNRLSREDDGDDKTRRVEVFALEKPAKPPEDDSVTVVMVPKPLRSKQPKPIRAAAHLFRMRWQSACRCVARVLLSGKTEGYSGRMPGILEEGMMALALGQPIYVLGGFGGAAALLGQLLGLATVDAKRVEVTPATPIGPGAASMFTAPGYETLPHNPHEATVFLAGFAINGPRWPYNGLTVEENRELYALGSSPEDIKRAVGLLEQGLQRRFGD